MQFVHRDHVITRDPESGLYEVREHGDEDETILALAGSLADAVSVVDSVLEDADERTAPDGEEVAL